MRKKKIKYSEHEIREKLGKHFGVGFMRSIGFVCKKIGNGSFNVYKEVCEYGKVVKLEKVSTCGKDKFIKVALENGFDPKEVMSYDNEYSGFRWIYKYIESRENWYLDLSNGINEVFTNINAIRK